MRPASRAISRIRFVLLVSAASGWLVALPATAIEFRAGQDVVVGPDEVIRDDLYVTGDTVTVKGRVEGDVITSGRQIRMTGEVTGDLMAAGQAVVVDGVVGDDIRMAGMALQLGPGAAVADDVIAAGFSLESKPGSVTRGSLLFAGFQALLGGEIGESLLGSMNGLEIRGAIGGDSEVEVGGKPGDPSFAQYLPSPVTLPAVSGGLTIADTARLGGALEYTSAHEARGSGAALGAVTRKTPAPAATDAATEQPTRKPSWPGRLFKLVGLIGLGLLLAWWIPGWLDARSGEIRSKPLPLAGIGLLGLAALPVAFGLALAVVVVTAIVLGFVKLANLAALVMVLGLVVQGLLLLGFWLTFSYLAPLVVGLCTGRWLMARVAADKAGGLVLPLVAGLALLGLLGFVPFLGFLVGLVVLLLGWGAILAWSWRRLRPRAVPSAA